MGLLGALFGPNIGKMMERGDHDGLVDLLQHERSDVRVDAIAALRELGCGEAIPHLVRRLGDAEHDVARAAEGALSDFGDEADQALCDELSSDELRAVVVTHLRRRKPIGVLVASTKENNERVAQTACELLVEILPGLPPEDCDEVTHALRAAVGHRCPGVRACAARLLGDIGDQSAARALAAQLKDGTIEVREACTTSLEKLGVEAVPEILFALGDRNSNSRFHAAELLGAAAPALSGEQRQQVVDVLEEAANDRDAKVAEAARRAVARFAR